eukprot:9909841-Ditylum_brightwellii.AAC.1
MASAGLWSVHGSNTNGFAWWGRRLEGIKSTHFPSSSGSVRSGWQIVEVNALSTGGREMKYCLKRICILRLSNMM